MQRIIGKDQGVKIFRGSTVIAALCVLVTCDFLLQFRDLTGLTRNLTTQPLLSCWFVYIVLLAGNFPGTIVVNV